MELFSVPRLLNLCEGSRDFTQRRQDRGKRRKTILEKIYFQGQIERFNSYKFWNNPPPPCSMFNVQGIKVKKTKNRALKLKA
jgi:hypothetical protein